MFCMCGSESHKVVVLHMIGAADVTLYFNWVYFPLAYMWEIVILDAPFFPGSIVLSNNDISILGCGYMFSHR